uniref:Uncharacterized protein n=1 Tax=Triticum urartu TaxID=4572 RepID=A0A8R7PBQ5_TRIUA
TRPNVYHSSIPGAASSQRKRQSWAAALASSPPPAPRCRCWSRWQNFKLGRAKSHISFSGGDKGGSLLFIGVKIQSWEQLLLTKGYAPNAKIDRSSKSRRRLLYSLNYF